MLPGLKNVVDDTEDLVVVRRRVTLPSLLARSILRLDRARDASLHDRQQLLLLARNVVALHTASHRHTGTPASVVSVDAFLELRL